MDLLVALNEALAGRYLIQREIGAGGMARVFLAHDERHGRSVAIKVLLPELVPYLGGRRFEREIRIAARLSHPYIMPLLDSGIAAELPFYVMPYLEGETLRQRLARERQLPIDDALQIAREVAEALEYAHGNHVIHRDLKPENLLLTQGRVCVADFGVAAVLDDADIRRLTSTGIAVGTPSYMSPEQLVGSSSVDSKSDQYSFACVVYEMLGGQPPFTGPSEEVIAGQHFSAKPRAVTDLRPSVPWHVNEALMRALSKAPADRFRDMNEFAAGLVAAPSGGVRGLAPDPSSVNTPTSTSRRMPRWALAAVLVLIALISIGPQVVNWIELSRRFAPNQQQGRRWVLVPEFEGPSDDPQLAHGARELVCAALDQSGLVTTVPREQLAKALHLAGRSDTTRVDAPLGRELAYRNAIRTVLEGRLTRVGASLAIVLRLVDSETDNTVLMESATAKSESRLVETLGTMVKRLRAKMGEARGALEANRALEQITTPSLQAFRWIQEASRLSWGGDESGAMAAYRSALELDPDCADAYAGMADIYHSQELPDSALWALDQALQRPSRLSDARRLALLSARQDTRGDLDGALEYLERCERLYPDDPSTVASGKAHAALLAYVGRNDDAIRVAVQTAKRMPFDQPVGRWVVTLMYLNAGRYREADSLTAIAEPEDQAQLLSYRAMMVGNAGQADSLAKVLERSDDRFQRANGFEARAAASAIRGSYGEATAALELASRNWTPRLGSSDPDGFRLALASLGAGAVPEALPHRAGEGVAHAAVLRAWRAALLGHGREASQYLKTLETCSQVEVGHLGAATTFVNAEIASREGRWNSVIDSLADIARSGRDIGYLRWNRIGPTCERWLVADAYARMQRPDSAAAILERVVAHPMLNDRVQAALGRNLARLRLVEIYSSMGRRVEARRHWEAAAKELLRPDPWLHQRMVTTRAALEP